MRRGARLREAWPRILASLAITLVLAFLLLSLVPLRELAAGLAAADPWKIAAAAVLTALAQVARSARLCALAGLAPGQGYRIAVLHNVLSALLPARLGEASMVLLLRRSASMGVLEGTGVLLAVRAADMLMVAAALGLSGWLALAPDGALGPLRAPCLWGGIAAAMLAAAMPILARTAAQRLAARAAAGGGRIAGMLAGMARALAGLSTPRLVLFQAAGLAVWLLLLAAFHAGAAAVVPAIEPAASIFASAAGLFAFALPVNGVAQVGPFEAAFAAAGVAAGLGEAPALAAAVLIHLVSIAVGAAQACLVLALPARRP